MLTKSESGLFNGFESYVRQDFTVPTIDREMRKEWLKNMIKESNTLNANKPESGNNFVRETG